ncbi:MAG: hypothetical protein ABI682_13220 [Acidobacteriota bacterium]
MRAVFFARAGLGMDFAREVFEPRGFVALFDFDFDFALDFDLVGFTPSRE